jgi:amino acid transporter
VGLSISIIAPTLAMSFNVGLAAKMAGTAAPLAFAIGTVSMVVVGLSFAIWSRRLAHAGSAYGFVTQAFGKRWGFLAGWSLLLTYLTYGSGTGALVGNFVQAAARTYGYQEPRLWFGVSIAAILIAILLAYRDMRMAGRTMLILEAGSLLAVVFLAVLILTKGPPMSQLSWRPFVPSPDHHGWAGVGYGMVFAVMSFGGFEAAATLGEETNDPRRNIPVALLGTLLGSGVLYVVISYAQIIGFGLNGTDALVNDPAPVGTLAVKYVSRGYAIALDLAAALGGFSCVLGAVSASGRMLFALSRAGLAPMADRVHARYGTPGNATVIAGAILLLAMMAWAPIGGPGAYYSSSGTVGTLALIVVYMGVSLAEAFGTRKQWRNRGSVIGITGVLLMLWPFYNSIYPVPAYPDNLWPFVLLAWLLCGALLLWVRPALVQAELPTDILRVESTR